MGVAEAGLPPKKPGCYLADVEDCKAFMKVLQDKLSSVNVGSLDNPLKEEFEVFTQDTN